MRLQVLQAVITIGDNLADFIADLQLMPQLLINVPLIPGKNWPINEKFKNAKSGSSTNLAQMDVFW